MLWEGRRNGGREGGVEGGKEEETGMDGSAKGLRKRGMGESKEGQMNRRDREIEREMEGRDREGWMGRGIQREGARDERIEDGIDG